MERQQLIFGALYFGAIVSYIAQYFIDFNSLNIAAASLVLGSTIITLLYLQRSKAFIDYPLSSFAILGLLVTTQLGAMIAQLILWTSLTKDLRAPELSFVYFFVLQLSALLAHAFYRMLANTKSTKPSIIRYTLEKIGLYATPSVSVIWLMAMIGLVSSFLARGDGGSKVANGIQFVMWVPFLIPIYRARLGEAYCNAKLQYSLLGLYAVSIVVIGIAINVRGFMLNGFVTVAANLVLICLRSNSKFSSAELFKIFMVIAIALALAVPLSQLSTAMVVARSDRDKVSSLQMINKTVDVVLNKPELIAQYRAAGKISVIYQRYDEYYIANPMLNRFVLTKYHDNMIYFGSKFSENQVNELAEFSLNNLWTILPEPMLNIKWLNLKIDKNLYFMSMGDYMSWLAVGERIGTYKTGSDIGQGFTLFGWFFPFLYLFMCIVLLYLKDLFAYKTSSGEVWVAPAGLFGLYGVFLNGLSHESLTLFVLDVIRNVPQSIILYVAVYQVSRLTVATLSVFHGLDFKKYKTKYH